MVVHINVIVALFCFYILGRVILVERIYIPSLNTGNDVATLREVPLTFETWVLDKVLLHIAILYCPLWLHCQVGNAECVYCQTIAINKYTLVWSNGITIGMIQTIGIIECTTIGWIADTLVGDKGVATIVKTYRL